jgi:dihydroxyacid dehydratase/phosphogluconate dehydratase
MRERRSCSRTFVGGPLALVRDGDIIELDIPGRPLTLQVSGEGARPARPCRRASPCYARLFSEHASQANEECDFDSLERGAPPDQEIH